MKKFEPKAEVILQGVPVSPGIAIGRVFMLSGTLPVVERRTLAPEEIPAEIERLHRALEKTKDELSHDQIVAHEQIGDAAAQIFEVHHMILEDPDFLGQVEQSISTQSINAEFAFHHLMSMYADRLTQSGGFLMDRRVDLEDVDRRVVRNLLGDRRDYLNQLEGAAVVVASDLTPSAALLLNRHRIRGFATDLGGKTSHAAIMLHSYGLPAVVGLREITKRSKVDDRVIIDGHEGLVLLNPDEDTLARYQRKHSVWVQKKNRLRHLRELPSRTRDGRDVELSANLEFADEVKMVQANGAHGVGLLRTEYLYLERNEPPSEDVQYQEYYRIASELQPQPVIIRTMDLGGDKSPKCIKIPPETNPFLGWRAIRICLEMPHLFKDQLKAILRANTLGNVKIMLPMISGVQELDEALALIEQSKRELKKAGKPFGNETEIGVMIEVPSAAVLADHISERVDFISIGTNDLMQYTLAADRGNERIAHLLNHLHPALLRLIRDVITAAHSRGVLVGMCGEMAADRLATVLLVGMEIDQLSVSPVEAPEIKRIIRSINFNEARELVKNVMAFSSAQEIQNFVRPFMRRRFKDLMI
ncbi:MAG: phosphoenolpyruvate--protein phosphotransferase [bacterium]